jgi:hypothetical protein
MWAEVNFKLSEQAEHALFGSAGRSPRAFRKMLAALDTKYGIELGPDFFGYAEDGGPKTSGEVDTTTGIGRTPNGLKIVTIGMKATARLHKKAPLIHSALINQAACMIPMSSRAGEHSANFLPFERRMVIRNLCVGHARPGDFWFATSEAVNKGATWVELADRKIPKFIGRALMRQAVLHANEGDDLEGNVANLLAQSITEGRHWRETGEEFGQRLGIKLLGVKGHTYIKIADVRPAIILKDVEFSMRGEFTGPWLLGKLKIEAQGLLLKSTRTAEECA